MVEHTVVNITGNNGRYTDEDASHWTPEQVKQWIKRNGYKELEARLSNGHQPINGQKLLSLTRDDLQQSPFLMTDLHEVDHLHTGIEALRKDQLTKYMKKIDHGEMWNSFHNGSKKHPVNGRITNGYSYTEPMLGNDKTHQYSKVTTPLLSGDDNSSNGSGSHVSVEQYPTEKLKTFIALMYMMFGFVVSVLTLQLVHERVPSITEDPPLPDIFFDIVPKRIEGAFSICETVGMVLVMFTVILCVFHKHRFIICRRIFFIMGTLYLYRSCTIYVTTLPVPGLHFKCAPKTNGDKWKMLTRAAGLLYGGGLSVTGAHNLCGDYLFSGHTIVLVITYLVLTEYTPKRWWWLHWISWLLAAIGIVCILLAHDHYTVDVVVAYLLTTRLFWSYHTMCNVGALKDTTKSNLLSRAWWFPIFRYFEGNVSSNGRLPRQYEWPLPSPYQLRSVIAHARRSPVKGV